MSQVHWLNPVSADFNTGADWSGGVVPAAGDDAILDAPGAAPYTVTASTNETVASIQTAARATLDIAVGVFAATGGTGGGANGGTILIGDAARLSVSGTIDNVGDIALAGGAKGASLAIGAGGATFTGGGTVTVTDSGVGASQIVGGVLTNIDNTLAGHLEFFADGLINAPAGIVEATGAVPSEIDTPTIVNSGLLESIDAGGLFIVSDRLDNSGGGRIFAGGHSTVLLLTTVVGGTLKTAGEGVVEADTATFDGTRFAVTNNGAVTVAQAGSLTIDGIIHNAGTISLTDGRNAPTLVVGQSNAILIGGGTVFLGHDGHGILNGAAATATLTNIDNTLAGAGHLGLDRLTLINKVAGVIDANVAQGLVLETGAGSVVNAGLIEATGAGGLTIRETVVDALAGGVIKAANGSHVGLQEAILNGGTLTSVGTGTFSTFAGGPDELNGTTSAVVDQAKILIQGHTELILAGAIDNSGAIDVGVPGHPARLTIGAGGATLSGGGAVALGDNAGNRIVGAVPTATLTNLDNAISGGGQIGAGVLTLVNDIKGTIVGSLATALVLDTGANTIVNAGRIEATGAGGVTVASAVDNSGVLEAAGGVLTLASAVNGTGHAGIDGGTLDAAAAFTQKVVFGGVGGMLELSQSQSYDGDIFGFSRTGTTTLDLRDIGFVGASQATYVGSAAGGVLSVTDGTHTAHIHLRGDYRGATFTTGSDSHGGTWVIDPAAAHRFVAAAAGLGAGTAATTSPAHEPWRGQGAMLARPGMAIA